MRRFTAITATVMAMLAGPAQALPNAFWIFGFHMPGKSRPKRAAVTAPSSPSDQVPSVARTNLRVCRLPTPQLIGGRLAGERTAGSASGKAAAARRQWPAAKRALNTHCAALPS